MSRWVPWYARIGAKLILSRLPFNYSVWRKLNLFRHGAMHEPEYAYRVFREHFQRAGFDRRQPGFVVLELGPGDSLLSAVVAAAHGANRCYLVDVGSFATQDVKPYFAMAQFLEEKAIPPPPVQRATSVMDVLLACNASYGTAGLESLRQLATASVDFVWSHAVLEHIRLDQFLQMQREIRRVIRADGVCSHRIDLQDHLGGALNNLRIPRKYWEAEWMAKSGFYTNRLRFSQMSSLFEGAGFDIEVTRVARWKTLPTAQSSMAGEFQNIQVDDLLVQGFDVLLRPR